MGKRMGAIGELVDPEDRLIDQAFPQLLETVEKPLFRNRFHLLFLRAAGKRSIPGTPC